MPKQKYQKRPVQDTRSSSLPDYRLHNAASTSASSLEMLEIKKWRGRPNMPRLYTDMSSHDRSGHSARLDRENERAVTTLLGRFKFPREVEADGDETEFEIDDTPEPVTAGARGSTWPPRDECFAAVSKSRTAIPTSTPQEDQDSSFKASKQDKALLRDNQPSDQQDWHLDHFEQAPNVLRNSYNTGTTTTSDGTTTSAYTDLTEYSIPGRVNRNDSADTHFSDTSDLAYFCPLSLSLESLVDVDVEDAAAARPDVQALTGSLDVAIGDLDASVVARPISREAGPQIPARLSSTNALPKHPGRPPTQHVQEVSLSPEAAKSAGSSRSQGWWDVIKSPIFVTTPEDTVSKAAIKSNRTSVDKSRTSFGNVSPASRSRMSIEKSRAKIGPAAGISTSISDHQDEAVAPTGPISAAPRPISPARTWFSESAAPSRSPPQAPSSLSQLDTAPAETYRPPLPTLPAMTYVSPKSTSNVKATPQRRPAPPRPPSPPTPLRPLPPSPLRPKLIPTVSAPIIPQNQAGGRRRSSDLWSPSSTIKSVASVQFFKTALDLEARKKLKRAEREREAREEEEEMYGWDFHCRGLGENDDMIIGGSDDGGKASMQVGRGERNVDSGREGGSSEMRRSESSEQSRRKKVHNERRGDKKSKQSFEEKNNRNNGVNMPPLSGDLRRVESPKQPKRPFVHERAASEQVIRKSSEDPKGKGGRAKLDRWLSDVKARAGV